MSTFAPICSAALEGSTLEKPPHALCRAIVIVPARNEECTLGSTLDALRRQVDSSGRSLDPYLYEVLLLLNNCSDGSVQVARDYQLRYPEFCLLVQECVLAPEIAHVGTARRMLMDLACTRLEVNQSGSISSKAVILSTDADTIVADDWIVQNLAAIDAGAEAVGGVIHLFPEDLAALDDGTRTAYMRDRELQTLVAHLESLLDPDKADPWPRHLEHFGASLACTCEAYRRCGGLPPVKPLEDVAFVAALRRAGARIRHAPEVQIYTSARLDGRAEVGLSGQLRHWRREASEGVPHIVDSAEWLEFRFRTVAMLRQLNTIDDSQAWRIFPKTLRERITKAHRKGLSMHDFLDRLNCDRLLEEMFQAQSTRPRHAEIVEVIAKLKTAIKAMAHLTSQDAPSAP